MGPLSDIITSKYYKPTINWGCYDYNPPMHSGNNNNNNNNSNTNHIISTNKNNSYAFMGSSKGCNIYDPTKWNNEIRLGAM